MLLCIECLLESETFPAWIQAIAAIVSLGVLIFTIRFTKKSIEISEKSVQESEKMNKQNYRFNIYTSYDKLIDMYCNNLIKLKVIKPDEKDTIPFPEKMQLAFDKFEGAKPFHFLINCRNAMNEIKADYYTYLNGNIPAPSLPQHFILFIRFNLYNITRITNSINEILVSNNFNDLEEWQQKSLISKITDNYLKEYYDMCEINSYYQSPILDIQLRTKILEHLEVRSGIYTDFEFDFYTKDKHQIKTTPEGVSTEEISYLSILNFVDFFDLYITLIKIKVKWEKFDDEKTHNPLYRKFNLIAN